MVDITDFLVNIFGQDWERVWLAQVYGDPGLSPWSGGLAKHRATSLDDRASLFFSISSLKEGAGRRRIENVDKVHVLVADDMGTKGDKQALLDLFGPPTYVMETSQGNEQWGFVYDQPLEGVDGFKLHTALVSKLADLGLADRVVDTTRLVRLPAGHNTKPSRNDWPVSLLEADWSRKFDPLDMAMSLDVSGDDIQNVPTRGRALALGAGGVYEGDVWLAAMQKAGIVRGVRTNGVVTIECPWEADHTKTGDDGTGYLGRGRFKCQHAHCADKPSLEFQAAVQDMISERLSGGLVPGHQLLARECFDSGLDGRDQDVVGGLSKFEDELTSFDEALDRLVFALWPNAFFDLGSRRLLTRQQVDVMCRLFYPPGASGVKAAHNLLLARRELKRVMSTTYRPGSPLFVVEDYGLAVNLWHGNDGLVPEPAGPELKLILDHLALIAPDPVERKVLEQWMAHQVQKQGVKVPWMPVILGQQGTGKDMLLMALKNVLGPWNVSDVTTEDLAEGFNPWIKSQIVVVQELSSSHRFDLYNKLKPMIAAPPLTIKMKDKHEKVIELPNIQNWIATTNNEGAAAITSDDRRLWVLNSPAVPQASSYYDALGRAVVDGAGQFLKWLQDYNLAGWDWNRVPSTAGSVLAKQVMAQEAASPDVQKVLDTLDTTFAGRTAVTGYEINQALGGSKYAVSRRAMGEALRLVGGVKWQNGKQLRFDGQIERVWCLGTGAATLAQADIDFMKATLQKQRDADRAGVFG